MIEKKRVVLYAHAGSGNHGCEALANTISQLINHPVRLLTNSVKEDEQYSLKGRCEILPEKNIRANKLHHLLYYGYRMITKDRESFLRYRFSHGLGKNSCLWNISIGGDNYCYESMINDLILANRMFHRNGGKTILLGCSVEPELLKRKDIVEDMKLYDAVFARESITYEALKNAGVENLYCYPDSAFFLETVNLPLPKGFEEKNTVGINISPMIVEQEQSEGITVMNYEHLIRYILEHTTMSAALIPHVIWERNDDRKPLRQLYEKFKDNPRVIMIEDCSASELKGYISRCRFFIGARTHATIAAYSSCVPTLVVGYSVKAKGIAKDLFGTDRDYVKPVQELATPKQLVESFQWLYDHEKEIKNKLDKVMPEYIGEAKKVKEVLSHIIGEE